MLRPSGGRMDKNSKTGRSQTGFETGSVPSVSLQEWKGGRVAENVI